MRSAIRSIAPTADRSRVCTSARQLREVRGASLRKQDAMVAEEWRLPNRHEELRYFPISGQRQHRPSHSAILRMMPITPSGTLTRAICRPTGRSRSSIVRLERISRPIRSSNRRPPPRRPSVSKSRSSIAAGGLLVQTPYLSLAARMSAVHVKISAAPFCSASSRALGLDTPSAWLATRHLPQVCGRIPQPVPLFQVATSTICLCP